MPAAMRLLPSSHLSSLMVGVPFTFPPPTPLLRSTTLIQKMLASREIYRLSSPDVPNERSRFAAAGAAADLSPSSTTPQYYLIHPPRLGLFNPIQILSLNLS
ncbi:hypothetical protein C4D60_Mb07t05490 [Musa balbisiana]|uniref:Uncharacterized protein n=1 Tax=Musa balbisiana TaxID=52838 RepID=A0A4S8JD52_MUSBA|nr:hypothetical protein C4D60_Mb07t05490 [Musa balbisiana]